MAISEIPKASLEVAGPQTKAAAKPKLDTPWVKQIVAEQLAQFVGTELRQLKKEVRLAIVGQVEAMLRQELGNLSRTRAPPRHPLMNATCQMTGERFVRAREFQLRAGIEKTLFYALQQPENPRYDPSFPARHQIVPGGRAVGYLESEVEFWISKRPKTAKELDNESSR